MPFFRDPPAPPRTLLGSSLFWVCPNEVADADPKAAARRHRGQSSGLKARRGPRCCVKARRQTFRRVRGLSAPPSSPKGPRPLSLLHTQKATAAASTAAARHHRGQPSRLKNSEAPVVVPKPPGPGAVSTTQLPHSPPATLLASPKEGRCRCFHGRYSSPLGSILALESPQVCSSESSHRSPCPSLAAPTRSHFFLFGWLSSSRVPRGFQVTGLSREDCPTWRQHLAQG